MQRFQNGTVAHNIIETMDEKELKHRLKWLRNNRGITQINLAKELGLKISAIQSHEYGQYPNRKNMLKYLHFYKCDEVWLKTGQGKPYTQKTDRDKPLPIYKVEDRIVRVAAPKEEYNMHGGWQPRPEMQDEDHNMLGKAFEIIRSNSIYSATLRANINAFHAAMLTEKTLSDTRKQLDNSREILKNHADTIRQMQKRLNALEEKRDPPETDASEL